MAMAGGAADAGKRNQSGQEVFFNPPKWHWQHSCEKYTFFCLDVPVKTTSELMHGDTSKQSIIHWFNFCTGYMFRHPVRLGGVGRNDIVEVDEALYKRKNKYHRSHDRGGGKLVFGAIERITNKVI